MINKTTTQTRKKYTVCQSCGSPFSKNKNNFTGGFYDVKYCTECFTDDHFTEPDLTIDGMKRKILDRLQKMGMPGNLARFTDRLHTLERWKDAR
jgi:hypothetical protein